jgi:leader peptidase (prepilin peptidase) / N-methyltransferase
MSSREAEVQSVAIGTRPGADGVVLFAAGLAALICLARVGLNGDGVIAGFVAFVLVRLAAIDAKTRILPNRIVLPSTGVVLAAHAVVTPPRAGWFLVAAAGAAGAFLVLALLRPGALGMGDVKLAMLLGAALGGAVVPALALGSFSAGLFAAGLVFVRGREALKSEMPLGPFLAFGGLVLLLLA